jgi:hypothetical protein
MYSMWVKWLAICKYNPKNLRSLEFQSSYLCEISSLMMEAVRTSETSVDNHFTRQYNPEDSSEHSYLWWELNKVVTICTQN